MTREGTMARLGVDIGALDAPELPAQVHVPNCPGARLRVTRHDYEGYTSGGEHFVTERKDIPFDGYGDVRVRCDQYVAQLPKTANGCVQFYGLCHSCALLEARNREDLRERAKARGDR